LSEIDPGVWSIERGLACCDALRVDGVAHGFGLRSHDVGPAGSFEQAHRQSRRRLAELSSCGTGPECLLRQLHGAEIVSGGGIEPGGVEADGACERVDRLHDRFLAVRTADCVPILLASREGTFVAAVHAGWRGTARGIVQRAVRAFEGMGCPPATVIAAVGPAIGACCYTVSEQIAREVAVASGVAVAGVAYGNRENPRLDLRAANRRQMLAAGIPAGSVHLAPWCTSCEADLFFSYRREGAASGRQLSLIGPVFGRP
jgi:YfiH family protein